MKRAMVEALAVHLSAQDDQGWSKLDIGSQKAFYNMAEKSLSFLSGWLEGEVMLGAGNVLSDGDLDDRVAISRHVGLEARMGSDAFVDFEDLKDELGVAMNQNFSHASSILRGAAERQQESACKHYAVKRGAQCWSCGALVMADGPEYDARNLVNRIFDHINFSVNTRFRIRGMSYKEDPGMISNSFRANLDLEPGVEDKIF